MNQPNSINSNSQVWRKCTTCKNPIFLRGKYWVCSVSTCTRQRTGLVFCNVACFDAHVPVLNHRDAGAIEMYAPAQLEDIHHAHDNHRLEEKNSGSSAPSPRKVHIKSSDEIIVVVSKVKAYIKARSSMNTSEAVMNLLSDKVRVMADQAIQSAEQHQRKTVLDRDVK